MFFHETPSDLRQDLLLRRARMRALMLEEKADALLVATNVNLLYATGRIPDGYLYMDADGDCTLFLRRPHSWAGEGIVPIKHPGEIPAKFAQRAMPMPRRLMMEQDMPHSDYAFLASLFPQAQLLPSPMRHARMIKTPLEQQLMRDTALWHGATLQGAHGIYQRGMTDRAFEAAMNGHFLKQGHLGYFRMFGMRMEAVMGCVLAGDNAGAPSPFDFALGGNGVASLPFSADGKLLEQGTTVSIDISGNLFGYMTDMTRVFTIGEAPLPDAAYHMQETALAIQSEAVRIAKVGLPVNELYDSALHIVHEAGLDAHFMGFAQQARFVGHGLGLEVNEPPVVTAKDTTPLQEGMTIALEPKFILPGVGALGVENTFLMTEHGFEQLTHGPEALTPLMG